MPENIIQKLINPLMQATQNKKLEWTAGASDNSYISSVDNYAVQITSGFDSEVERSYFDFTLMNKHGQIIDSETVFMGWDDSGLYDALSEVYQMARGSALKIDQAVEDIINNLNLKLKK